MYLTVALASHKPALSGNTMGRCHRGTALIGTSAITSAARSIRPMAAVAAECNDDRCELSELISRRLCLTTFALTAAASSMPPAARAAQKLSFQTTATGLRWADISIGGGEAVGPASRVTFHVKGRLVGKQGWIFVDTVQEDEPYRLSMGRGEMIAGLEEGLLGMRAGGQRRLVVPSTIGYQDREHQPVPRSFGQRQRLFTTVLNDNRKAQEAMGLGDGNDVAGVVALDVEVITVRPPVQPATATSDAS